MAGLKYGFDLNVGSTGVALGALVVGGIVGFWLGRGSTGTAATSGAVRSRGAVRHVKQSSFNSSHQMSSLLAEAM